MKRYLIIIVLAALSLTAMAQQKKVAVYVTGQQSGINKVLGDQLVAAFAKSGKYIAIERTASFLAELGKEQNYQRTGAVDDNELSRLGKQFGVQLVCVADVSDVFGEKYVSARLIDVESAEVVNTSNANSKLDSMNELLKVAENIAKELTSKTVHEKAAEAAAIQKANEETEKMLSEAFTKGYMRIENLYVTTSSTYVRRNQLSSLASECRIGGFSDWRLPTNAELQLMEKVCDAYNNDRNDREKYPNLSADYLGDISKVVNRNRTYWTANDGYVRSNGVYRRYNSWDDGYGAHLILVRDAK